MKYQVATWGPSPDHPNGIMWGAPVSRFSKEIQSKTEQWGQPLRVVEMDSEETR